MGILAGKTALVTGASHGIGRAIAFTHRCYNSPAFHSPSTNDHGRTHV